MKISLLVFLWVTSFVTGWCQDGFVAGSPALAFWQVSHKKEVIIVLHGGPAAQHEYLRPEFDALKRVATVIYYDQRGCGKSAAATTYIWQEHIDDLRRVIRTFTKNKRVFLAGSSWGSTLAIMYAYSHPEDVKGLILTGTYPWEGKAMPPYDYAIHRRGMVDVNPFTYKIHLTEQRLIRPKAQEEKATERTIPITKTVVVTAGNPQVETRISFATAPVLDSLKSVAIPVLIFNGTRRCDITDWGNEYVKILPNAELCTITGACHDPWLSDPAQFFARSRSFVRQVKKLSNHKLFRQK